jgi:predicted acylesterase/phospholipase RssA
MQHLRGETMTKCAFIASGGGMKAYAFHVGVFQALEDSGFRRVMWNDPPESQDHLHDDIKIGTYIGSSAGACVSGAAIFLDSIDDMKAAIGIGKSKNRVIDLRTMIRRPKQSVGWRISSSILFSNRIFAI